MPEEMIQAEGNILCSEIHKLRIATIVDEIYYWTYL
jgi:hypothetical protein